MLIQATGQDRSSRVMSVDWVGLYQFVNVIMMYKVARKIIKMNKE